jgi:hypothetical protein
MEKATIQQLRFIASLIKNKKEDSSWLREVWESTNKNNDKYPDTRCDYRNQILAERLSNLSLKQADYVIKAWNGEYGYHTLSARDIIIKNLIN